MPKTIAQHTKDNARAIGARDKITSVETYTGPTEIGELDDKHLDCRDLGHSWRNISWKKDAGGRPERLARCNRCNTARTDRFRTDGSKLGTSKYDYASNYLLSGTTDRRLGVKMQQVRRELIWRKLGI